MICDLLSKCGQNEGPWRRHGHGHGHGPHHGCHEGQWKGDGCKGKRWRHHKNKEEEPVAQPEEEKKQEATEEFKYQSLLNVLVNELGIDENKAKAALLKHQGDFELAVSMASKMPDEKPKDGERKRKKRHEKEEREGLCEDRSCCGGFDRRGPRGFGGPCGPCGPWGQRGPCGPCGPRGFGGGHPFKQLIEAFVSNLPHTEKKSSSDSESEEDKIKRRQA